MSIAEVLETIKSQVDKLELSEEAASELTKFDFDSHAGQIRKAGLEKGQRIADKAEQEAAQRIIAMEERIHELESETEEGQKKQTQAEKAEKTLEKMAKKLELAEAKAAEAEAMQQQVVRNNALEKIRRDSGVNFTNSVSLDLADRAWKDAFKDADIDDADDVAQAVTAFREVNPGLILTDSNGGAAERKGDASKAKGTLTIDAWKALPFDEQHARRAEVI